MKTFSKPKSFTRMEAKSAIKFIPGFEILLNFLFFQNVSKITNFSKIVIFLNRHIFKKSPNF